MNYEIFNPTVTHSTIADPYTDSAGLTYVSNSSLVYYAGKYWAIFDGTTQGYIEGATGQQIYLKTSTDGVTWGAAVRPFRDAAQCNNPLVATVVNSNIEWQPNLVVVGTELWCTWSATGVGGYVSKLTSPTAKWTNYRFEFVGTTMYLSQTVEGATTSGRLKTVTINGLTDYAVFPSQNPIVLHDGTVACPVVLFSSTLTSAAGLTGAGTFTKQLKYNVLFLAATDGSWTMSSPIDNSDFGDFCSWEPYVTESADYVVSVFSRSLNPLSDDSDFLLVSESTDGGHTFSKGVSTKQYVPSSRGYTLQVSPSRWLTAHCDAPERSTRLPTQSLSSTGRINGALFASRTGRDDSVPGIPFSNGEDSVNYPQMTVGGDGCVVVNYTRGTGSQNLRRAMIGAKVTQVFDDTKAYIYPRSYARYLSSAIHGPEHVAGTPSYKLFDSYSQAVSNTTLTTSAGVTYSTWLTRVSDLSAVIADTRTTGASFGTVSTLAGLSIGGVSFLHTLPITGSGPVFLAVTIDTTARTVTQYYSPGGALQSWSGRYESFNFIGQPTNNETLTVNGLVYTFKTTAVSGLDVQIGGSAAATATNLIAKLTANALFAAALFGTRVIVARTDYGNFAATSQTSQIVIDTVLPLTGGTASIGYKAFANSSLVGFSGSIYNVRIDAAALTTAQLGSLYNAMAPTFGYATLSGTSAPSSPVIYYDGADAAQTGFTVASSEFARAEVVNSTTLRLHGEGSAGVELPHGATKATLKFKLGALPTGTEKYVVATFGNAGQFVRLHLSGAAPNSLYANDRFVKTIADPTVYNTLDIIVSTNKVTLGSFELYFAGRPRMYLGTAVVESLLPVTKTIDFDTNGMTAIAAQTP